MVRNADGGDTAATPEDSDAAVLLAEERLKVSTRVVDGDTVTVKTQVEEDVQWVRALLVQEDVDVERVAIGREIDEIPQVREVEGVTIIPVVREVLHVEKRLLLVEEVRVTRSRSKKEFQQPVASCTARSAERSPMTHQKRIHSARQPPCQSAPICLISGSKTKWTNAGLNIAAYSVTSLRRQPPLYETHQAINAALEGRHAAAASGVPAPYAMAWKPGPEASPILD